MSTFSLLEVLFQNILSFLGIENGNSITIICDALAYRISIVNGKPCIFYYIIYLTTCMWGQFEKKNKRKTKKKKVI